MDGEQILLNSIIRNFIQCLTGIMHSERQSRDRLLRAVLDSQISDFASWQTLSLKEYKQRRFWMKRRSEDW